MDFISIAKFHILWEGVQSDTFIPTRGLRQRDPLSLYIFTFCIERVAHIIKDKVGDGN